MKSARERAEEKRAEKLYHVREQVQSGSLVIRKIDTAAPTAGPARGGLAGRNAGRNGGIDAASAAAFAAASALATAALSAAILVAVGRAFSDAGRLSCAASTSRISLSASSGVICPRFTMY